MKCGETRTDTQANRTRWISADVVLVDRKMCKDRQKEKVETKKGRINKAKAVDH